MSDVIMRSRRISKIIGVVMAIFVIGYFVSDYQSVFAGLILGSLISAVNISSIAKETSNIGGRIVRAVKTGTQPQVRFLGGVFRFLVVGGGGYLVIKYPEYVHGLAFIFGLLASYFVMIIDFVFAEDYFPEEEVR